MNRTLLQVLTAVVLLAIPLQAGYIVGVTPDLNYGWYHFFYGGADNGWNMTPGSGSGASYYYDCCPAYRNHAGSYVGVRLPGLLPGESVMSATLYLYVTDFGPFNGTGASATLADLGALAPGTFNGWNAGTFMSDIYPQGGGWLGLDATSAVLAAYGGSLPVLGFNVGPAGAGAGGSFLSFSPAGESYAPYLEITTSGNGEIPEPATVSLLAAGLGLIALCARRRRARAS